jgi:hypothetical protein
VRPELNLPLLQYCLRCELPAFWYFYYSILIWFIDSSAIEFWSLYPLQQSHSSARVWGCSVLRTQTFCESNQPKNADCVPSHMMALLGFASFYKVKPLLPQRSFCLRLCGTVQDSPSSTWLCGGLPIEIFNRSNPFLCAPRCVCVTDRVDRCAFQFGAIFRCSDA